jgi:hypothetical protein
MMVNLKDQFLWYIRMPRYCRDDEFLWTSGSEAGNCKYTSKKQRKPEGSLI